MKKKKATTKKLVLAKETVLSLEEDKLKAVAGGYTVIDRNTRCCPEN